MKDFPINRYSKMKLCSRLQYSENEGVHERRTTAEGGTPRVGTSIPRGGTCVGFGAFTGHPDC
jgi:hypothetical protein